MRIGMLRTTDMSYTREKRSVCYRIATEPPQNRHNVHNKSTAKPTTENKTNPSTSQQLDGPAQNNTNTTRKWKLLKWKWKRMILMVLVNENEVSLMSVPCVASDHRFRDWKWIFWRFLWRRGTEAVALTAEWEKDMKRDFAVETDLWRRERNGWKMCFVETTIAVVGRKENVKNGNVFGVCLAVFGWVFGNFHFLKLKYFTFYVKFSYFSLKILIFLKNLAFFTETRNFSSKIIKA